MKVKRSRRLSCHRCLRSFKSLKTLTIHFRDCFRSFSSRSHLRAHMLTHTSDRPYACAVEGCSYRARTAGRLFQHKVIHGKGRRFSCDYCDYSATTSSNLRRHARIHAGSRPYLCPHCDRRTSTLDALKKHVLDSGCHPGLPLYVCPWCSDPQTGGQSSCVGFNASSLAWRHLTTEHQEKLMNSDRFKALGRSSGNVLLERDVTRLLGIYSPEVDSTQPPEGVPVRQPAVLSRHRRRKDCSPCTSTSTTPLSNPESARSSALPDLQIAHDHPPDQLNTSSNRFVPSGESVPGLKHGDIQKSHCGLNTLQDNVSSFYHLVQLGCGALWSRDAFSSREPSATGN